MESVANIITVIGKNSKLYKKCNFSDKIGNIKIIEYSHLDVANLNQIVNPIIFSLSKVEKINDQFLLEVLRKSIGKVTLISSISAPVYKLNNNYSYPKIKWKSENILIDNCKNWTIVRVGIVDKNYQSNFCGRIKLTDIDILNTTLMKINTNHFNEILELYDIKHVLNFKFKIVNSFFSWFFKRFPKFFHFLRPLDLCLKILGYKNYGYTFIANQ